VLRNYKAEVIRTLPEDDSKYTIRVRSMLTVHLRSCDLFVDNDVLLERKVLFQGIGFSIGESTSVVNGLPGIE
jgi:hypothetical protein